MGDVSIKEMKVDSLAGSSISKVCTEMGELMELHNCAVVSSFNGTELAMIPKGHSILLSNYYAAMSRIKSLEYQLKELEK